MAIRWLVLLACLAGISAIPVEAASRSPRARALSAMDQGHGGAALALLDSLSAADPGDGVAAYWGARAIELAGRVDEARCRYLAVEAGWPEDPAGELAGWRRRHLERSAAEAAAARGPDAMQRAAFEEAAGAVLILPPEDLGGTAETPLFGLAWVYLLQDALRGSGVCPVPVSTMLVAADLLRYGRPVRAPATVSALPVNTLDGLRARLAVLPGADGGAYLSGAASSGEEDAAAVEAALLRFQRDRGLAPTGQADLATQARLEEALEAWCDQPPAVIDPRLVVRAAQLTGATAVVRGTYRRDAGRIVVELVPLDASGAPAFGEPIVRDIAPGALVAAAAEAGATLAARFGRAAAPPARWSLPAEDLMKASGALLLLDRGLARAAEARLRRAPELWNAWPAIEATRRALGRSTDEAARLEAALRRDWATRAGADPRAALDGLFEELGWPGAVRARSLEPGVHGVIGSDGILIVHGEEP